MRESLLQLYAPQSQLPTALGQIRGIKLPYSRHLQQRKQQEGWCTDQSRHSGHPPSRCVFQTYMGLTTTHC